jgi:hypothetical protein
MVDDEQFLGSLLAADRATQMFIGVVINIARYAEATCLNDYSSNKPKSDRFEGILQ